MNPFDQFDAPKLSPMTPEIKAGYDAISSDNPGAGARYLLDNNVASEEDIHSLMGAAEIDPPIESFNEPNPFDQFDASVNPFDQFDVQVNPFDQFDRPESETMPISTAVKEIFAATPIMISSDGTIGKPSQFDAYMQGLKSELTSVYRGVKQMLGMDEDQLKEQETLMASLYADDDLSTATIAGAITGAVAEPVGMIIPAVKAKSMLKAVAIGAGIGMGYGASTYVNEDSSRLGNATIGLLGGAAVGAVVRKVSEAGVRKGHAAINKVEEDWAKLIADGMDPTEAMQVMKGATPKLGKILEKARNKTGRKPMLSLSPAEAQQVVKYNEDLVKATDLNIGGSSPSTIKKGFAAIGDGLESIAGIMSTRMRNINEPIFGAMRKYEFDILVKTKEQIKKVDSFVDSYGKILSKDNKALLDKSMLNGDMDTSARIIRASGNEELAAGYKSMRGVIKYIGEELVKSGRLKEANIREGYFPRMVKDYKGLINSLGREEQTAVQKALRIAEESSGKAGLTSIQRSDIMNKIIRGYGPKLDKFKPGFAKQRKYGKIPDKLLKFYATPEESLNTYIRNSMVDIEKSKFFGTHASYTKVEGTRMIDLDKSIGGLVDAQADNMTPDQLIEMNKLLNIRFGIGERSTHETMQMTKNLVYSMLLANPWSAATQLADIGSSVFINGITPTLMATARALVGKSKVSIDDLGLVNTLSEEFVSTTKSARWLRGSLKWSGFSLIDRIGKETLMNSSLSKYTRWSKTEKGRKKFAKKYEHVFGDDFSKVVDDLQNDRITDNVKLLVFNELADIQPIAKIETPQKYLEMPNGRVIYMLKSFMLKQMDTVRRESYQKIKEGDVALGLYQLARYGMILGSGGAGAMYVKQWMSGIDVEVNLKDDIPMNIFKMFGLDEYTQNKAGSEGIIKTIVGNALMPPVSVFDRVFRGDKKSIDLMPVWGKGWNMWFNGGMEEARKKHMAKKMSALGAEQRELEREFKLDVE